MASPPYSAFLGATPFLAPKPPLHGPFLSCSFPSIHSSVAPSLQVSVLPGRATQNSPAPRSSFSRPVRGRVWTAALPWPGAEHRVPESPASHGTGRRIHLRLPGGPFPNFVGGGFCLGIRDRLSLLSWLLGNLMFPPLSSYWLFSAIKVVIYSTLFVKAAGNVSLLS